MYNPEVTSSVAASAAVAVLRIAGSGKMQNGPNVFSGLSTVHGQWIEGKSVFRHFIGEMRIFAPALGIMTS